MEIIVKPYEDYILKFNKQYEELLKIVPTIDAVNDLESEEDELKFVQAFRELMRTRNVLVTFSDFNWGDLNMFEQEFEDYKSKYLDLYDKTKKIKEKESILEDVDFEIELIHRDEINVSYILQLLIKLKNQKEHKQEETKKMIYNLLSSEMNLRSKKELIEQFIQENLPYIEDSDDVTDQFEKFWDEQQRKAFDNLVKTENLSPEKTEGVIEHYLFAEKEPLRDELLGLIIGAKPTLLERKPRSERIMHKIVNYVDTFVSGFRG
jgi:type I restriction enzyme R subunit